MEKNLPVRGCNFCLKSFRPKRRWQRFCSMSCRRAASKEDLKAEYTCEYCGLLGETVDHIPPISIRPILVTLGLATQYPFILVRACHQCNSALSDIALWTVELRRAYIAKWLKRRYRRYLALPLWSKQELEVLEYNLRQMTLQGLAVQAVTRARLERAESTSLASHVEIDIADMGKNYRKFCEVCNKPTGERFCSDVCEYAITGKRPAILGLNQQLRKSDIRKFIHRVDKTRREKLKTIRLALYISQHGS